MCINTALCTRSTCIVRTCAYTYYITDNTSDLYLRVQFLEVRAATMAVLARVAHLDPLHIMPIIRLTMERLIKQLAFAKDLQLRQESVLLIQAIVKGAGILIAPYVEQLLNPLIAIVSEPSTNVIGPAIATLAEIAVASPLLVQTHVAILRPRMIQVLNDSTSLTNREIAVVAIGKYMSSVITIADEPFTAYASLLDGLVRAIQTESDQDSSTLQVHMSSYMYMYCSYTRAHVTPCIYICCSILYKLYKRIHIHMPPYTTHIC